jgi:hypothetical protein
LWADAEAIDGPCGGPRFSEAPTARTDLTDARESEMEKFAISVLPVADVDGWKQFLDEATTGDRAASHRDFLRRGGITGEHVFHQQTPMGDLMVLVWEGIDQAGAASHMGGLMESPQSDHERYLRDHLIPEVHGVDLTQSPPPPAEHMTSISL